MRTLKLICALAVAALPLWAQAEMKALDDAVLSEVTGQAGISISGTFQAEVGAIVYTDTDVEGGTLRLENISLPGVTVSDDNPITIDVVNSTVNNRPTQQLAIGLPEVKGDVTVKSIRVGDGGSSIGSLSISGLNMAGSTVKIWGH